MDASQSSGASALPAEERAAAGGNLVEGDPSVSSRTPQASTQTAQSIAQGDNVTPLETGLRQRGNVESQRAVDTKTARDTSLVATNRERRQEQLKAAQELVECLGAGMDLLSAEQVKQIKEAAAAAGNEPGEALRSFGERLRDLRRENPHASEADLKEAVKSAVQAMINRARGPRRHADTRQATAESETQRDTVRLPETRRATRQDVPGPRPAECCGEQSPRSSRRTTTSAASGVTCTRQSGIATRSSSGVIAELCILASRAHTRQPTGRLERADGIPRQWTA